MARLVAFSFSFIICLTPAYASINCHEMQTCGACIQVHPECAWCQDENFDDTKGSRCDILSSLKKICKRIQSPVKEFYVLKNSSLSEPGVKVADMIQLAPQKVHLALRPGEPFKLTINYRQATDYPVDLYYIMDLSGTMREHKNKLASLGDLLAAEMSKITENFRLGFGAFVDKVILPYTSTTPEKLKHPCSGDFDYDCAPPFGFINVMPLSARTNQFKRLVSDIKTSGNIDTPEGGLDALMQAVVCETPIGWRNVSRKLIVYSTDAGYHIAGDGKLAGIVKPNDGHCYLAENGTYLASTLQDYPSISHLNAAVSNKNVHIIFAVTKKIVDTYKLLAKRLEGSGIGELHEDSRNVVQLIQEQYNKISSTLILKDNADSDIRVTYHTRCLDPSGKLVKNNTCEKLKVGTNVQFEIHIEVKRCPKDMRQWRKEFKIWPQGIDESVDVMLDLLCQCECELPLFQEPASKKCAQGNGTFVCGICSCNPKRYGRKCECGLTDTATSQDDTACSKDNSSLPCSGVGLCVCGMCDCSLTGTPDRPLSGKYCECDDFQCPSPNNQVCSGNGRCVCGACECDSGWGGDACDCPESRETCVPPNGQQVCNGNGQCQCGRCECKQTEEGSYIGKFCDECPKCTGKCDTHWRCVICQEIFNGAEREICRGFNCSDNVILVDGFDVNQTERFCVRKDTDDCKVFYKYGRHENDDYYILVQKTKECQDAVQIGLIAGSVVAGVVAIGIIALLIWKLFTSIHDRKEYARFENERKAAKWDQSENPLYKPSTTQFSNPTFTQ